MAVSNCPVLNGNGDRQVLMAPCFKSGQNDVVHAWGLKAFSRSLATLSAGGDSERLK